MMFDAKYYLKMNPDVAEAVARGQMTAQEHYLRYGKFENRAPSPFFDPVLYARENPDVAAAVENGTMLSLFDHFALHGQQEGREASLFFNAEVYLAANPDVAAAVEDGKMESAWFHFINHGQNEVRNTSQYFDMKAYLDANPDVAAAVEAGKTTAYDHFIEFGFKEGRDIGNGISLASFAEDPASQEAIASGDVSGLMARVAEVAPFLPAYTPPAGYEIPSNQPIPQGFVPVDGETLVIPDGVIVPDGQELPPAFRDVVTTDYGKVSDVAMDGDNNLWVGSGNPADNFNITRTSLSQVELALKGYVRGSGDVAGGGADGTYNFARGDKAGFAFSVASLGERSISDLIAEGYSFHLKIDNDSGVGFGENSILLTLQAEDAVGTGQDSGFKWVRSDAGAITDDEGKLIGGEAYATQNIQSPLWYGAIGQPGSNGALLPGNYSVSLEMRKGSEVVASQEIALDIAPISSSDAAVGSLDTIALKGDGTMINGSGNSGDDFQVVRIDAFGDSAPDIEIALGGQQRGGPATYTPGEDGAMSVPAEHMPVFKFSVASLNGEISLAELLNTYDIKLQVDTDKTADTSFITLKAVANSDSSTGGLDWLFESYDQYKLVDDQGSANVSQNIQALSWYQPNVDNELFKGTTPVDAGLYTVRLEVFEKGTVNLVGSNEVTFDVAAALG